MVTGSVQTEPVIVVRAGTEMLARSPLAPTTATIMVNALMASATAVLDLPGKTARFALAHPTATTMDNV